MKLREPRSIQPRNAVLRRAKTEPVVIYKDKIEKVQPEDWMSFWDRLKFLFTKKKLVKKPALKDLVRPPQKGEYAYSYTTFGGMDIRLSLVEMNTDEQSGIRYYAQKGVGCYKGPDKVFLEESQAVYYNADRMPNVVGWLQPLDVKGELITILFGESVMNKIDKLDEEKSYALVMLACNEYGDTACSVLENFVVTSYSWAISVDDLVSEEHLGFEASNVLAWQWVPSALEQAAEVTDARTERECPPA